MFELKNASISYGESKVLHNISLTIVAGERIALLGRSGVGKTSLIHRLRQHCPQRVALVPQDAALVSNLSVFHNVYMGQLAQRPLTQNLRNLVLPSKLAVKQVMSLLISLGIADKLRCPVRELSGGQQQRVAVARALFQQSESLLGDEPVSAVDASQAAAILDLINNTYQTTVLAMHDVSLALNYCDRIVGLKDGAIAIDTPSRGLSVADLHFLYDVV